MFNIKADSLDHTDHTAHLNHMTNWTTRTPLINRTTLTTLTDQRTIKKIIAEFALLTWYCQWQVFLSKLLSLKGLSLTRRLLSIGKKAGLNINIMINILPGCVALL